MQLANKPQFVSELVKQGYKFFVPLFKELIPIILLSWLAAVGVMFCTLMLAYGLNFLSTSLASLMAVVGFVAGLLMMAFFFAAMLARAYAVMTGDQALHANTWKVAKEGYLPLTGALLMVVIVMMLLVFVLGSILTPLMATLHELPILFFVLSLVPLFLFAYIMVRLFFVGPYVVLGKSRALQSLADSWKLVSGRHNWFRSFSAIVMLMMVPAFGFSLLTLFIPLGMPGAFFIIALVNLAQALIMPVLTVAVTLVLFNDLKLRKSVAPVSPESTQSRSSDDQQI